MPLNDQEILDIKTAVEGGTYTGHALLAPLASILTFRSAADEGTYKGSIEADAVRRRDTALYTEFEAAIEEETGIKKNSGEKATDYYKRATGGIKQELADLKAAGADGGNTTKEKARITELEGLLNTKSGEVDTAKTEYETKLMGYKVGGEIRAATAAVTAKLLKTLTGDTREDIIEARVNKFKAEYTPELEGEGENEVVVWKKKDGSFANDTKGKRLTTEAILSTVFDAYIDKGHQQGGTGTGRGKEEKKDTPTTETYTPPSGLKTQSDLIQDLKANGFLKNSKEFSELFAKHKEGLALR